MTATGAPMIRELHGNLLADDADALVNTVNTVGVMGKGIALQFKRAYPKMFGDYSRHAKAGRLAIGEMHVWETCSLTGPRFIINFPTKRHWKAGSRIDIRSIAVPPLGCGHGGLEWAHAGTYPRSVRAAGRLGRRPGLRSGGRTAGARDAESWRNPTLTPMRAALLSLMSAYHAVAWEWPGPVETQKLAYFLQEAGQPLRLSFVKGP